MRWKFTIIQKKECKAAESPSARADYRRRRRRRRNASER